MKNEKLFCMHRHKVTKEVRRNICYTDWAPPLHEVLLLLFEPTSNIALS